MNTKYKIFYTFSALIILFIISIFIFPVKLYKTTPSSIIYDVNEIEIGEIISQNKIRHRFKKLENIPDFTKQATILIEDKNFYNNSGIDFIAIMRALKNNIISNQKIEGASTISTQVIRNNYWLNEKRTYLRKIKEFYLALSLNSKYSKNEILEHYLNNIYYGYLNYGIESASHFYFDKDINNLTKAEQIALIILPKNPAKYNPYNNLENFNSRFKNISNYLNTQGLISDNELDSILSEIIFLNYNYENKLPYIVDFLKKESNKKVLQKESNIIKTTIDYNLTKKIEEISKNVIDLLLWKDVGDYGVIITDRETNELKVMIGGIDYYLENGQVNSTTSLRQVGSTIKPFTYLLAFKDLLYKPETIILDLPIQFNTINGNTYSPKNYSLDYKGEVTLAEALSQSINVPAVKLTEEIGLKRLYNFLKLLKISSIKKEAEYYGLALTLGVSEMTLYELLQAYSIFANEGNFCEIKIIPNNIQCNNVIESEYIEMVNTILTNRYFKLKGFPINSNLDFKNKEIFVKTGTSRNFRDNWTLGFTEKYMIGVWVGNKDGTYMKGVSGATGAGEIFKEIVKYIDIENHDFKDKKIIYKEKEKKHFLKIISPLDKSIYKIDNNKPKNISQIKLEFQTNIKHDAKKWFINNKEVSNNFLNIKEGQYKLRIELFQKGILLLEDSSSVEILK